MRDCHNQGVQIRVSRGWHELIAGWRYCQLCDYQPDLTMHRAFRWSEGNMSRDARLLPETNDMTQPLRLTYLRVALVAVGIIFIAVIYPLTILWPSGWKWNPGHSDYLLMILGVYATLGVFLLSAARDPLAHLSLIWFTIWSSVVHGAIMTIQSMTDAMNHGHLLGDVTALFIVAIALAALTPRRMEAQQSR